MSILLLTIPRPFPDIILVEIFKPYKTHNTVAYPVKVDGVKTTIESTGIQTWKQMDPAKNSPRN